MEELEMVVLAEDLPDCGLEAGDVGTVVLVHEGGEGYEVEFAALDGETITVVTLESSQAGPVGHHEIAHVRMVAG